MRRLLVHFARYGAYHRARLRTAVEALAPHGWEVFGLEIASTDSTYAWAEVAPPTERDIGEPLIITAFPGRVHEEITAAEYRRVLHPLLDGLAPDAMAIAGWGSRDAASCLSWCRRHEVRRIVMSETRHADGRRVWWKEMLKHYVIARFDAALVGGKSHRDYLVKLGLPADKIRLGYNVVNNGYFAAEAERWREKTQDGKTQDAREDADGGGLAAEEMPRVGGGLTRGETPRETAWRETRQPQRASHDPRAASRNPRAAIQPFFLASNRFVERKNLARLVDAYAGYVESFRLSVNGYQGRKEGAAGQGGDEITQRSGLDGQEASHLHLTPLATSGPAQRSSPTGPWNLVLLGDGELREKLIAKCHELGLQVIQAAPWESFLTSDSCPLTSGTVFFPGFRQIDDLPRFYAHAGAFVHPAMEEPWGLVINEAMACGLPVLSSRNVGAAEELVDEGVNGWGG
jgi:glycosyltransferase involved in cell wall biosynthesis